MWNKDKSLERRYKKKKVFHSNRYTKIPTTRSYNIFHTSVLAGTNSKASASYNYSDASTNLSAKKLKLKVSNRDASDNESHFNSSEANTYKNIQDISQMEEVLKGRL